MRIEGDRPEVIINSFVGAPQLAGRIAAIVERTWRIRVVQEIEDLDRFLIPVGLGQRIGDLVTAGGKVSTGHSALEVDRAARAFRAWLRANSRDGRPYTYASERLTDVPVWMANTAADIVIQKQEARAFIRALKGTSSSAARKELWLPYSRVVRHDAIITPANPELPLLKNSLREFLGQIH
jgi:hypothetical protein